MTCKRHNYIWLPAGSREIPVTGNLYMLDLGLCQYCGACTSRVTVATPGDQMSAELWGRQRFEVLRRDDAT